MDLKVKQALIDKIRESIATELNNQNFFNRLIEDGLFLTAKEDDKLDFSSLTFKHYGIKVEENIVSISGGEWALHLRKTDKSGHKPSGGKINGVSGKVGKIVLEVGYEQKGLESHLLISVIDISFENPIKYDKVFHWPPR